MKRILCYGDSNTWGSDAEEGRLVYEKQWPNILKHLSDDTLCVVQEGLGGRTAGDRKDPRKYLNGQLSYEVAIRSAWPVDVVVLSLGTNDLKTKYSATAKEIAKDLLWYIEKTNEVNRLENEPMPQFIFIAPANFIPTRDYYFAEESVRQELITLMKNFTYPTIVLNDLEMSRDGVHYAESAHVRVAGEVFKTVKEL